MKNASKWDDIRNHYQDRIKEIQASIDYQLEMWAKTGSSEHLLFAEHEIQHLKDIKDYIIKREKEAELY